MNKVIDKDNIAESQAWAFPDIGDGARIQAAAPMLGLASLSGFNGKQAETDTPVEQGFEKGKEEGMVIGKQQAYEEAKSQATQQYQQQWQQRFELLQKIVEQSTTELNIFTQEMEKEVFNLIKKLVTKIVLQEMKADPQIIMKIITEAKTALPSNAKEFEIFLNPQDVELLSEYLDDRTRALIKSDEELPSGGVRAVCESASVDASLDERLAQLVDQVIKDDS